MRIEIPLERFMELYRLVALGKLIHGLVHNLNGPLQNLGMDVEMMENGVMTDERIPQDLRESLLRRLQRIEGEFDNIIRLIRSAAGRIGTEGDPPFGTFKGFLEEEISFLNADLYFKHSVRKEIRLAEGLPPLGKVGKPVVLALTWLIQALAEEMEKGNAKLFSLTCGPLPSAVEISLTIEGGSCKGFLDGIVPETPLPEPFRLEEPVHIRMPLALMRIHGVDVKCTAEPTHVALTLRIPI